jgi:hypothetical protein
MSGSREPSRYDHLARNWSLRKEVRMTTLVTSSSSWTSLIPFGSTREKRSSDCVLLGSGSGSAS